MFQQAGRGDQTMPRGVVVASYDSYEQAQAAVAKVSKTDADVAGLAIVGNDLKLIERVVGRLTWGKVALAGAMRGLGFGAFIGLVYMLLVPEAIASILLFPLLGLAFGILLGVVTHSMTRRKRDFASVQQVLASRYDVIAPNEIAGRAMHVIGQRAQGSPSAPTPPAEAPRAAPPMVEQLPGPGADQGTTPEQPATPPASDDRR